MFCYTKNSFQGIVEITSLLYRHSGADEHTGELPGTTCIFCMVFLYLLPKLLFGVAEINFQCKVPTSCCMAPCFFFLQTLFFIACCGVFLFVYSVNTIWSSLHSTFHSTCLSLWNWRAKANLVEGITWDRLVQCHMWLDRIRIVPPEVSKESLYIIKCYIWFHLWVDGYGLRKTDPRVVQRGLLGGVFLLSGLFYHMRFRLCLSSHLIRQAIQREVDCVGFTDV